MKILFAEVKQQLSLSKETHFIFCWKTKKKKTAKKSNSDEYDSLFLKMPDIMQLGLIK